MKVRPRPHHRPVPGFTRSGAPVLYRSASWSRSGEIIAEYDAGGLKTRFVRGAGPDEVLVQYDGGTPLTNKRWLIADERGSIVGGANSSGASQFKNAYDEYGRPAPTNSGRFQYTGQLWLSEIGLYHYKARLYSPGLGRFLQTDPIGYADALNLYAYVANDPVNNVDPNGEAIAKAVKFIRQLVKNGGDFKKAGKDIVEGTIDNFDTLKEGQLNGEDLGAAVDLALGLDKKDQAAAKAAVGKTANALKNSVSPNAIAKTSDGAADGAKVSAKPEANAATFNPDTNEITMPGGAKVPVAAGRGEAAGIREKTESTERQRTRSETLDNAASIFEEMVKKDDF